MGAVFHDVSYGQETSKLENRLQARMVNRCVAAGCSNTHGPNISLHRFPSNPILRDKWTKQVNRTRAHWKPTKHSVLCSEHFTADCFIEEPIIAAKFGISKGKRLKPDAVPSIFPRHFKSSASSAGPSSSSSTMTLKRQTETDTKSADDIPSSKKRRTAVEKRERLRVSTAEVVHLLCELY